MKHYKSVEFLVFIKLSECQVCLHKRKASYWRLFGNSSVFPALQPKTIKKNFVYSKTKEAHTTHFP